MAGIVDKKIAILAHWQVRVDLLQNLNGKNNVGRLPNIVK